MLFSPESHESLIDEAWNPSAIEAAIREIAADAEAAFDDGWPAHPLDEDEPRRFRTVYLGGAGVIRALDDLQRRGLVDVERDYLPYLDREYVPDFPEYENDGPSLLMGETGMRLVLHRLAPSAENLDRIAELIAANARDERRELMWGSPGTMLVADTLSRETGEPRWTELWRESAALLDAAWEPDTGVWTQELYGGSTRYFGPAHGFAGCMLALAPGGGADERAATVARRYAIEDDGLVELAPGRRRAAGSWPRPLDPRSVVPRLAGGCRVARRARARRRRARPLLRAGGELTWRAARSRRAPTSATARPATATPSSHSSSARVTRCGSSVRGRSRCTPPRRSRATAPRTGKVATRCGPAIPERRSTSRTVSRGTARCRCRNPGEDEGHSRGPPRPRMPLVSKARLPPRYAPLVEFITGWT